MRGTGIEDCIDINSDSIYSFIVNSSKSYYYYSYEVYFDGMEQEIWVRNHNENCLYKVHGKIIIKQSHRTLIYSQLTLVHIDAVLLDNWVVLDEWMMRLVVDEDVR